jgi:peroxiredoxin family protein
MPAKTEAPEEVHEANELSMIVFSGDLDKVLAAFIIATGAAVMDKPVTMFFTFWGLNVLRRSEHVPVKKSLVERMFGRMMPRGADKLKLSKMNMGGMGTMMMKRVMAQKNVYSLPKLMQEAKDAGVRLVACTMSMDVMGITKEERPTAATRPFSSRHQPSASRAPESSPESRSPNLPNDSSARNQEDGRPKKERRGKWKRTSRRSW